MAGVSGSVSALADHLVSVKVGHVVSSPSMVGRAYLVDPCVGVVIESGERGFWLASALSALAPDPDGLKVRAADKGGIPVEYGIPRLVKITLRWGATSVDLNNPVVAAGSLGAGAVSLAVPASLGDKIMSGSGPRPTDAIDGVRPGLGELVGVVVQSGESPSVRWARISSDPGYAGTPEALALDSGFSAEQAGSPVFLFGDSEPRFCGLVQPLDETTSILLSNVALLEAIPPAP